MDLCTWVNMVQVTMEVYGEVPLVVTVGPTKLVQHLQTLHMTVR